MKLGQNSPKPPPIAELNKRVRKRCSETGLWIILLNRLPADSGIDKLREEPARGPAVIARSCVGADVGGAERARHAQHARALPRRGQVAVCGAGQEGRGRGAKPLQGRSSPMLRFLSPANSTTGGSALRTAAGPLEQSLTPGAAWFEGAARGHGTGGKGTAGAGRRGEKARRSLDCSCGSQVVGAFASILGLCCQIVAVRLPASFPPARAGDTHHSFLSYTHCLLFSAACAVLCCS